MQMGKTRDYFEPWVASQLRPRYPELESGLMKAVDAFDAIEESKSITAELLAPIVEAASSSRRSLYENVSPLLGKLTGQFAEARGAVEGMFQDPRSHVRFNAILCLGETTPKSFTLEVLRKGLVDPSSKVRQKATDWAARLRLREIVPELELAHSKEKGAKVKSSLEFYLRLLRDGYILEETLDRRFEVTTLTESGGLISEQFAASVLKRRGIESIVAHLAKQ